MWNYFLKVLAMIKPRNQRARKDNCLYPVYKIKEIQCQAICQTNPFTGK